MVAREPGFYGLRPAIIRSMEAHKASVDIFWFGVEESGKRPRLRCSRYGNRRPSTRFARDDPEPERLKGTGYFFV